MPGIDIRVVQCGRWPQEDYENYSSGLLGSDPFKMRECWECAHLKRPDRNGVRICKIKKRIVKEFSRYGDRECWNVFKNRS